ncbi:MAG: 2,3-bisphosphoglycerate-independent phosphoglycerate mutase [Clostridia bacterium]
MKYLLVVGDGMADRPIEALCGKTPLGYLNPQGFQTIAGGELGRLLSCPRQLPPGSDTAFLTLLGNDTPKIYTGRSPLEAAGMGVVLSGGEVCFRLNLVAIGDAGFEGGEMLSHNGGGIDGHDAYQLITDLMKADAFLRVSEKCGLKIYPTDTFRHAAVIPSDEAGFVLAPPHDIVGQDVRAHLPAGACAQTILALEKASFEVLNHHPINEKRRAEGKLPANAAWLWGAGTACTLDNFEEKYAVKGRVISAVPLVKGIARLGGLDAPDYPWATGLLDTDYEQKAQTALDSLDAGFDFVLVHLEAPDEMSHDGSLEKKLESMRRLNDRIVQPLLDGMNARGEAFRMLLMPDHYTLLSTRTHDGTPVPFALYDSRTPGTPRPFTEAACENCPVLPDGDQLMRKFFAR